jgi:hypothetical protein
MPGGMKGVEQDDGDGDGDGKKAGAADDTPLSDIEALTLAEFNRWLVTEENWSTAEQVRQLHIEGEQFRKAREDRHRERGQVRQQDTVEQMKEAKTRVDAHRRHNLEQGSLVKRDVVAWNQARHENRDEWIKVAKVIKQKQIAAKEQFDEHKAMLAAKKQKGELVKNQVAALTVECEKNREAYLNANKAQVAKVKEETGDAVIDSAKNFFFVQRKEAAASVTKQRDGLEATRKANRQAFLSKVQNLMQQSRSMRDGARDAKKRLLEERAQAAREVREQKAELDHARKLGNEKVAEATKNTINTEVSSRFAPSEGARRMLQHPHYAEVSAVSADVTSAVSREIATSPRRTLRRGAGGSSAQQALPNKS